MPPAVDFEDDDAAPSGAPSGAPSFTAADVQRMVNSAVAQAQSRTAVDPVERVKQALKAKEYTDESIEAAVTIAEAMTEKKLAEREQKQAQKAVEQVGLDCAEYIHAEIEKHAKTIPSLKWAKDTVYKEVEALMVNDKKYQAARDRFTSGKTPSRKDLDEALDTVIDEYCVDNKIQRQKQVDTETSKSVATKAASATGGDPTRGMTTLQQDTYMNVLNATGSAEKALSAAGRWKELGM